MPDDKPDELSLPDRVRCSLAAMLKASDASDVEDLMSDLASFCDGEKKPLINRLALIAALVQTVAVVNDVAHEVRDEMLRLSDTTPGDPGALLGADDFERVMMAELDGPGAMAPEGNA